MDKTETELDRWGRMTNPQCVADYGLSVDLHALAKEAPDVVAREVAPYLPIDAAADRTGLCTVREFAQYAHEAGETTSEMSFQHEGRQWNVELRITRVVDL